jgi:phospholipid/cholesterol/gamma-HCH transport system ATP-binding protein
MPAPSEAGAAPIIEVRDLVAHYGTQQILHDISLDVYPGEIMVIMGSSGSGKTTLLSHMLGLSRPTSGCIRLLGEDISQLNDRQLNDLRKQIGVTFQGGALFSSLTVAQNVQLPLREHTRLDESTIQIMTRMKLEVVNLAGFEHFMPSELSGGMVKRAAVARAIAMDPKLLFFDEPSAGLDPVVSAGLDDLILRLRRAMNITIVVVTHELQSAFKIADRITMLDRGRVVITGNVDEVRAAKDQHMQNLFNRMTEDVPVNADDYLRRLTENIE